MTGLMMDYPLTLSTIFRRAESLYAGREVVTRLADKSIRRTTYGEPRDDFAASRTRCAPSVSGQAIELPRSAGITRSTSKRTSASPSPARYSTR